MPVGLCIPSNLVVPLDGEECYSFLGEECYSFLGHSNGDVDCNCFLSSL